MKLLLLCIPFASLVMANPTATNTSTNNYVENTTAATFIQPLNVGGGDVFPMNSVLTAKSANCPSNQLILDLVNTSSGLRGSGAPSIGNYGMAGHIGLVIPFGDGGRCERHGELIHKSAQLEQNRNKHNLCMGELASFKAADPNVYLNDNFFDDNEEYRGCRGVFTQFKIAHKKQ